MPEQVVAKRFGSVKAARTALKGNRSNGALRRLQADETVKVRFLTEPDDWYSAQYHWINKAFVWCSQEKSCPGCKEGDRSKTTVLANAVIFGSADEREHNKVVVMQMTTTLANTLLKFHEKRETLLDRDYDLTREGSGLNDTVYSADPDDPKPRKMSRFAGDIHDIESIIAAEISAAGDDDEEDEDEDEPRSSKFQRIREHDAKKKKSSKRQDGDEYEDEEDDDEDEEEERPRKKSRVVAKKKPVRRSSHEDEDDDEEDEDEDEPPAKSKKSRAVVRRSR